MQTDLDVNVPLYIEIKGHALALKGKDSDNYLIYDCCPTCCKPPNGLRLAVSPEQARKLRKEK